MVEYSIIDGATTTDLEPGHSYMELALGYKKEFIESGESEEIIFTKNNYEIIPPEGIYTLESGEYVAFENGEYEFKVKILDTGEEIKEKVIVDEFNNSGNVAYEILERKEDDGSASAVGLGDISSKTCTTFEKAWISYEGILIDVSDCIEVQTNNEHEFSNEGYRADGAYNWLNSIRLYIKNGIKQGSACTIIILKAGRTYSVDVTLSWPE